MTICSGGMMSSAFSALFSPVLLLWDLSSTMSDEVAIVANLRMPAKTDELSRTEGELADDADAEERSKRVELRAKGGLEDEELASDLPSEDDGSDLLNDSNVSSFFRFCASIFVMTIPSTFLNCTIRLGAS
jgi:hypothetical protein